MIPTWEGLNRLGKSRLLQSSYVWLLIVPMAAKGLSTINDPIVFTGIGEGLRISVTLPFSWKLFYFSAVAISVAGLIYTCACPELIRNFTTFREFQSEGRGLDYLRSYAARLEQFHFEGLAADIVSRQRINSDLASEGFGEVFFQLH